MDNSEQGLQVHLKLTECHGLHVLLKLSYKLHGKVRCVYTYVASALDHTQIK